MTRFSILLAIVAPAWRNKLRACAARSPIPRAQWFPAPSVQLRGPAREQRTRTDHDGPVCVPCARPRQVSGPHHRQRILGGTEEGLRDRAARRFSIPNWRSTARRRWSPWRMRFGGVSAAPDANGEPRGAARAPTRGPVRRPGRTRPAVAGAGRSGSRSGRRRVLHRRLHRRQAAAEVRHPRGAHQLPTRSRPSTTAPVSRASRSSPNPAATSSAARPSRSTTTTA